MNTALPNYVEYGPRETAPPPFVSGKGKFLGLILKGDMAAITKLCDRVLNEPFAQPGAPPRWTLGQFGFGRRPRSQLTFTPFSDVVLLFSGAWHGLRSTPMAGAGSADEDQVSLWVPVKSRHEKTGEERVWMFVPYMFVNNPMSLLNGREDYGYQKAYATFGERQREYPGEDGSATVTAFGGPLGSGATARWLEVMKVKPASRIASEEQAGPASAKPFPVQMLIEILKHGVHQIFLKQFRDATVAGAACYQHLVEARVEFVEPKVDLLFGDWEVELMIPLKSSHPIGEDLGLQTTSVSPFSFTLTSELELEAGRIIV